MALANDLHSTESGLLRRIAALVTSFREARQRGRVFRQTMRELNALTERELADLGIARSMITRIAHEAAYGK